MQSQSEQLQFVLEGGDVVICLAYARKRHSCCSFEKRAQRSSDRTHRRHCANRVLTTASRNLKLRPVSGREARLSIINTRSSVSSTRKNSVPNRMISATWYAKSWYSTKLASSHM